LPKLGRWLALSTCKVLSVIVLLPVSSIAITSRLNTVPSKSNAFLDEHARHRQLDNAGRKSTVRWRTSPVASLTMSAMTS
jgi:hypothetical protein